MEYVYAAMLLHSAKQPISEEGVKKVLSAAGVSPDEAKAKALVSALEGVNIEEAIKQAAMAPVAAAPAAGAAPAGEAKKEEKKDEKSEAEKEAEAAAGLSALFG
jgi:large subunit ribosomal protein L12